MTALAVVLIGLNVIQMAAAALLVGKPRKPLTGGDVAARAVINTALIIWVVAVML